MLKDCGATERQVAQLSLTNPCDALHHDKRQNFKTILKQSRAGIDIAYLCTAFDDFRFSRSSFFVPKLPAAKTQLHHSSI